MPLQADRDEALAFEKVKSILPNPSVFAEPAGSATTFPDFGFRIMLGDKKTDIFFEFKQNHTAHMGSGSRDWIFDGTSFKLPQQAQTDQDKKDLIDIMNAVDQAKTKAKAILNDLKNLASNQISSLSSASLGVLKTGEARKAGVTNYILNKKSDYQIAKIDSTIMGDKIIELYKKKFRSTLRQDADLSIAFFMIKDTIWLVDKHGDWSKSNMDQLKMYFKTNTDFSMLDNLSAKLEVRIQPKPSFKEKNYSDPRLNSARLDTMAMFRLSKKPSGGSKII